MIVVSIEQKYGGHAKQTAMAVAGCYTSAYMNRYIIIVDEDIDPSNVGEVLWAIGSRCDPETSIDVLRHCYGTPLDTLLSPEKRKRRDFTHSKAIITACKPFDWINDFPISLRTRSELREEVRRKWQDLL